MSARAELFDTTPKKHVFHRVIVSSLVLLLSCTLASGEQTPHKPLVTKLAKDPITSLYTITIKADKSPLLLDLTGRSSGRRAHPHRRRHRTPLWHASPLAAQRGFGGKFALCLPDFATLGYGDVPPDPYFTPLLTNPVNAAGYYIPVKGISVSWHEVDAPAALLRGALDLDAATGRGGVVLSTATPYMIMRPDVFRAFAKAFDAAITRGKNPTSTVKRVVPAPKPFELCYKGGFPTTLKRPVSRDVPRINLELGGGATGNWTLFNDNYMVQVDGATCLAILPVGPGGMPVDGEPAVVIGGKQLENNLLVFDLEKQSYTLIDIDTSRAIAGPSETEPEVGDVGGGAHGDEDDEAWSQPRESYVGLGFNSLQGAWEHYNSYALRIAFSVKMNTFEAIYFYRQVGK
uniref:Basic 7S globulin 2 n=1 Tax=Aegilops tauschii TaxID=37682 RepID=M8BJ25_AEGTA